MHSQPMRQESQCPCDIERGLYNEIAILDFVAGEGIRVSQTDVVLVKKIAMFQKRTFVLDNYLR